LRYRRVDDLAKALAVTGRKADRRGEGGHDGGRRETIEGIQGSAPRSSEHPGGGCGYGAKAAERFVGQHLREARELRGFLEKINTNFAAETAVAGKKPRSTD